MTHAVVTTVGGYYSTYLPDWTDSILAQTTPPDQVVIVDNGADDAHAIGKAVDRFASAGINVAAPRLPRIVNYGRARNIAVDTTDCEWVQHFDVDDLMDADALEHTAEIIDQHPDADVIQWGWRKDGGRPPLQRIYEPRDGAAILPVGPKAAGVSPFRRALWEKAPYDDLLEGAWDTGLWVGFAHLNAKFRPTDRPVFTYRQHRDSVLNSRLRDPGKRKRVSDRLGHCYQPLDRAVVVMPWRDCGDADRRTAMAWCTERWQSYGLDVIHAADNDGNDAWNLAQARNNGAAQANARVLVIADADVMVDADTIWQAIHEARTAAWVIPHDKVHRLDADTTRELLGLDPSDPLPQPGSTIKDPYRGFEGGGLIVITPAQYEAAGGYNEAFQGWGGEDEAFAFAARTLIGDPVRLNSPLWHLFHDPGPRSQDPHWDRNRQLLAAHRAAAGSARRMTLLVKPHTREKRTMMNVYRHRTRGQIVEAAPGSVLDRKMAQRANRWELVNGDAPDPDADATDTLAAAASEGAEAAGELADAITQDVDEGPPPQVGKGSGTNAWAAYATGKINPVPEMKRDIIDALDAAGWPV